MSERDLTAIERDLIAEWDRASVGRADRPASRRAPASSGWVETRLAAAVARFVDGFSRAGPTPATATRRPRSPVRAA